MVRRGAHHEHLLGAGAERQDVGVDVDDGVGAALARLLLEALQGQVARVVVHVGELLDLAAGHAAQEAEEPPADAERISDIAHDEMARLEAGVELAVEVLARTGGGEKRPAIVRAGDGGADGDELVEVAELAQVAGDAGRAMGAVLLGLVFQPFDGGVPAVGDERREVFDLAARQGAQAAGNAARETERLHAVADDQAARRPALLREAKNFVARQAADNHGGPSPEILRNRRARRNWGWRGTRWYHHAALARGCRQTQKSDRGFRYNADQAR